MNSKIIIPYDVLYDLYVIKNMSQKNVAEELGYSIDTIVRNLKEYKIESHKPKDWMQNSAFTMSEYQKDILYGAMLGDGCLYKSKHGVNAQFTYTSKSKQHVEFVCEIFKNMSYKEGIKYVTYYDKRTNKSYERYTFRTVSNPTFQHERDKWYLDEKKIIPNDLILTPTICLIWYIGDGCILHSKNTQYIKLATQCFTKEDQEAILLPQLQKFEAHLIKADTSKNGEQQYFIYIPRRKIKKFLEYIGPCPFSDYQYKWDYQEYKNFSLSQNPEFIQNIIELFNSGISAGSIAKQFGVDRSTVVKYLIQNELNPKDNLFKKRK